MLSRLKNEWKEFLENSLREYLGSNEIAPLSMGVPPKREMGDVAFPMFPWKMANLSFSLRKLKEPAPICLS